MKIHDVGCFDTLIEFLLRVCFMYMKSRSAKGTTLKWEGERRLGGEIERRERREIAPEGRFFSSVLCVVLMRGGIST